MITKEEEIGDGVVRGDWKPRGGVVVKLELEKRLLNSLGAIAHARGLRSVYQMIRNALYEFVRLNGEDK